MSRTTANDRLAELRAMTYSDYLQTPEWRQRRTVAVDWARGACQLCNSGKKPLHVHHRTYDRLGAELPADLVVLCADCHAKFHGKDEEESEETYTPTDGLFSIDSNISLIEDSLRDIASSLHDMRPLRPKDIAGREAAMQQLVTMYDKALGATLDHKGHRTIEYLRKIAISKWLCTRKVVGYKNPALMMDAIKELGWLDEDVFDDMNRILMDAFKVEEYDVQDD